MNNRSSAVVTQDTQQHHMVIDTVSAAIIGLVFGLIVHGIVVYARDRGPTLGALSLSGNGAIMLLLLAPIGVLFGEVFYARRRSWLGMAVLPIATVLGLFVVLGGV
jgi:hypothetical protein